MGLKRILTPLDIHLDTRLGTIARLDQNVSRALLETNDYWTRQNDDWTKLTGGKITTEQFNEAYAQRGDENTRATLEHSIRTNITPFILKLLTDDHVNVMNQMTDPNNQICLTINYWPYVLSSEEIEWLRDIFHELYGGMTEVELISIPMSEVTPQFLNENFAACIMYEFPEWIKFHAEALGKVYLNCFNFISPLIFEADVSKLTVEAKQQIITAFRVQKLIHMDFEFIDASYFSVINVHGGERE